MGAVQPIKIPSPGFYGLAKDRADFPLSPEWAVEARNIVIDSTGRVSARKGWARVNSSGISASPNIEQVFEYINASGASEIISTTATKLWSGTTTLTEKTGALVFTDGNWDFVNFNGYVLGWKTGETPIQYSGSGNFATISVASGTLPDGNVAHAAFGRVWAVDDDGQTIRYSALLDHTKWAVADGGGLIDMRQVWTQGMDTVVSIASYGSYFVVFGKRHVILWSDGTGSQLGLNPLNMYVTDTIDNVGAVARDAVCLVGEVDVMFWSESGIRSLVRTMQERASPINDISPNNRNYIATGKSSSTVGSIRSAYSQQEGLVLFTAPARSLTFAFDIRQQTPDNGFRMTEWSLYPTALFVTLGGALYFGMPGYLGLYSTYLDHATQYQFKFESGWVDLSGQGNRKQALKALAGFFYTEAAQFCQFRWGVDFGALSQSVADSVGEITTLAEYGTAEFGIDEFGTAGSVFFHRIPLSLEAEYLKVQISTQINATVFALQPLTLYSQPTRLA